MHWKTTGGTVEARYLVLYYHFDAFVFIYFLFSKRSPSCPELRILTECVVVLNVLGLVKAGVVVPHNILKGLTISNDVIVCGLALP